MKKELKIDEKTALKLYKTANKELKEILEESFGKDFFNFKVEDNITTLNDLFEYLNINDPRVYSQPKSTFEKYINACIIIPLIVKVYNGDTILNWDNINEYKYLPYFKKVDSGWVFCSCNYWYYSSGSAQGYHYKSSNLGEKAVNNFKEIYIDYISYKG